MTTFTYPIYDNVSDIQQTRRELQKLRTYLDAIDTRITGAGSDLEGEVTICSHFVADEQYAGPGAGVNVRTVETVTSTDTLVLTDDVFLVDTSSGAVTINLPAAALRTGKVFTIKKVDTSANSVTIDGDGSETIDDTTTKIISSYPDAVTIISNGTGWKII